MLHYPSIISLKGSIFIKFQGYVLIDLEGKEIVWKFISKYKIKV